jgi:hypothetical protein
LIAPLALSVLRFAQARRLQIDYLMPAELFPIALAGGLVLLTASLRARSRRGMVAWSLGATVALLAASMLIASVTGLASGAAEPAGWRVALVAGLLAGYVAAVLVLAISGVLLTRSVLAPHAEGG